MNIFISNDDGIYSNGLKALADRLSLKNKVLVIAPDGNRSAAAHSLSIERPITVTDVNLSEKYKSVAISGTPVDCVKIAKLLYSDFEFGVTIAGINRGHNIGSDILYSGTVSIACEAAFFGDVAFAFSAFNLGESDFNYYAEYAEKIIDKLLPISSAGDIWNVNFPDVNTKIKGVKFASLGKHLYSDRYVKVDKRSFKLIGELIDHDDNTLDSDVELIKEGYITITPIIFNKTNFDKLKIVKNVIF